MIRLLPRRASLAAVTALATVAFVAGLAGPAWATFPGDNGKIAFVTQGQPTSTQVIAVVNPNGSGQVTLTSGHNDSFPAWSPDGRRIAFTRGGSVAVMNADGSNQVVLTAGGEPGWSPDGRRIAFESTRDDPFYVVVRSPRAGRWHIRADRPIRGVSSARGLPRPRVTATLRRRGKKEKLSYRLTRILGQSVRLVQHATGIDHDLGLVAKKRGTLTFTPLAGKPKRRTIIAYVTQNRLPRTTITVAHYTVR